jgi:hypothetical protein
MVRRPTQRRLAEPAFWDSRLLDIQCAEIRSTRCKGYDHQFGAAHWVVPWELANRYMRTREDD